MNLNKNQSFPFDLRRRGLRDSIRHDKRVREVIKKNLRDIIIQEDIISGDKNRKIRIPLRYLDQYRFRYSHGLDDAGQGEGNVGDVLKPGDDPSQGQPGENPGENIYEAEFTVDEIIRLMLEDLNLPWLEEKDEKKQKTTATVYDEIRRTGILPNLDKKRTIYANIKRNAAKGKIEIKDILDDDLRYKSWRDKEIYKSNAAIFLLMDRSGSMTQDKRYIVKSFFFWLVRFLRLKYTEVELVFIAHDTESYLVNESDFFSISNSGGTKASSAYNLALKIIQEKYPLSKWNNYVFYFGDGENWNDDNKECLNAVKELLNYVTMMGYGEIDYDDEVFYAWGMYQSPKMSTLLKELHAIKNSNFISTVIRDTRDIYDVLKKFLLTPNEE